MFVSLLLIGIVCSPQPGEVGTVADVMAIECDDRLGFFVPSERFRHLDEVERTFHLMESELSLSIRENEELRLASEVTIDEIQSLKERAIAYRENWYESESRNQRTFLERHGLGVGVAIGVAIAVIAVIAVK